MPLAPPIPVGPDLNGGGPPQRRVVAEFAGTPRAGKTTAIHSLRQRLQARGYKVHLIEERAVKSPVPSSHHPQFNLWTATMTSAMMLEAMYDRADADVVLIDRGLFDSLCWMHWYRRSGQLTEREHNAIEKFLCVKPLREVISMVLVMKVDPVVALQRERATWPPGTAKGPGTILNIGTLRELNAAIASTVGQHRHHFPLRELDTTDMGHARAMDTVAEAVQKLVYGAIPVGSRSD